MKTEYVFFLGGHDAEMMTIKELLEESNIPEKSILDKNLKWGAKLSEYEDELSKLPLEQIPVFVELILDIKYPSHAIIVDHHNDRAGKNQKTSIEQIADLLAIKLNRWQQLISANDKGFVWGMQEIGASEEEMKKVREVDKKYQGISKADEEKAKISIDHFFERISNDCIIVNSLTEKTTTITELVYEYYRHIFIITPSNKLNYSGTKQIIKILEDKYALLKKDDSEIETWSGGYLPDHGYFGSSDAIDKKEIIKMMEPFIEKERIHSQHIFMFPFRIDNQEIKECSSSSKRLQKIFDHIKKNNNGWQYKAFKIFFIGQSGDKDKDKKFFDEKGKRIFEYSPDEIWAYNEYNYFYDCVRETLFNQTDEEELFKDKSKSPASLYYEKEVLPTDEMVIYVKQKYWVEGKEKYRTDIFSLTVNHLSLRIFETGIGILSITLYNKCTTKFEDVLLINDFGRRIYPQFLGEQEENKNYPDNKKMPVDETKDKFLAGKISFTINGEPCDEEFPTEKFLYKENQFASYLEKLLKPLHDSDKAEWKVFPIIDDRMYTICWHENTPLWSMLQQSEGEKKKRKFKYEDSRDWYMYTFIDGKFAGIGNNKMKNKLIGDTAYSRFIEDGTIFGISRYSFVGLCSEGDFGYKVIRNHLQKMYFQMCVLLLAQRASIIKFNNDISWISTAIEEDDTEKSHEKIEQLQKQFIEFSNRIWFDEVTPQEQGIELYKQAQINMGILSQVNSLSQRINDLFNHSELRNERTSTDFIARISAIGAVFLPLTLLATTFCMTVFFMKPFGEEKNWITTLIIFITLALLFIAVAFRIINAEDVTGRGKIKKWQLIKRIFLPWELFDKIFHK